MSKENLARMQELTYKANDVLKKLFDDAGLILVDFKLEVVCSKAKWCLATSSPDGSRLWIKKRWENGKRLFRQSSGGLIEVYEAARPHPGCTA